VLDCRAYELTSAEWTGGYDVISNLVPGQNPFEAFPDAGGRVLYGVKDGGIPGTGYPTNRGIDPYVAERGENGWSTRYMGIPSNNPYAKAPFSSTLTGASADLSTALDPWVIIGSRKATGGAAPDAVRSMIRTCEESADDLADAVDHRRQGLVRAEERLLEQARRTVDAVEDRDD